MLARVTYTLELNGADQKRLVPALPKQGLTRKDYDLRIRDALLDHLPDFLDRAIGEPDCEVEA